MTHYNVKQNGEIYDGDASLDFVDSGNGNVRIDYRLHVRIGDKIFGSFVGAVKDFQGNVIAPKDSLSGALLVKMAVGSSENIYGVTVSKTGSDSFTLTRGDIKANVVVSYVTTTDFITITSAVVNAYGFTLEFEQ